MKNTIQLVGITLSMLIGSIRIVDAATPCPTTGPIARFCNVSIDQQLCVSGNAQINGNLTVSGAINGGAANYAYAYSTLQQVLGFANTYQAIVIDTNGVLNGWTHAAGSSNFVAARSGLYAVSYSAVLIQPQPTAPGVSGSICAFLNGAQVAGSALTVNLPESGESIEISNTFLVSVTAGQILNLQFSGNAASIQLYLDPNAISTVIPNVVITIVPVA